MAITVGKLFVPAVVLGGVLVGAGGYTFHYAHGTSYLSSDPKACVNCHIMQSEYDSWHHSSHHAVAGCVDCHLPQHGLAKWTAKAENGFHHSWAFTFQDFHEPIQIGPKNAAILQDNCLRCHGAVVHQMLGGYPKAEAPSCVHCHAAVGHGPVR